MIRVDVAVALLLAHWVADFVLQSDWQARNKSSNWRALYAHVGCYAASLLGMVAYGCVFVDPTFHRLGWVAHWVGLNAGMHLAIDAVTSRMTSRLYKQGRVHTFFVVIGFDQFLHVALLLATWRGGP